MLKLLQRILNPFEADQCDYRLIFVLQPATFERIGVL